MLASIDRIQSDIAALAVAQRTCAAAAKTHVSNHELSKQLHAGYWAACRCNTWKEDATVRQGVLMHQHVAAIPDATKLLVPYDDMQVIAGKHLTNLLLSDVCCYTVGSQGA